MYPIFIASETLCLLVNYNKKYQEATKWIANCLMYVSAIVISVSISMSLMPITYFGFFLAHVIWAFFAWKVKDMPLFWQFSFFIPLDIYAMYIRF